jgi:hypothetical protein
MSEGFSWVARWIDPVTRLPARIAREGFGSAEEARADALRNAPQRAVIAVCSAGGTPMQIFARQDGQIFDPREQLRP